MDSKFDTMSDAELAREFAEKVCGWRIVPLVAEGMERRTRAFTTDPSADKYDPEAGKFHPAGKMARPWNPLDSDSDLFVGVDALVNRKMKFAISRLESEVWLCIVRGHFGGLGWARCVDRRRAILFACLKAVEVEDRFLRDGQKADDRR